MDSIAAVVLAGGEGTRLRPLTHNRPKPLLPAATTPILQHVLDELIEAGVDEITIVVGYKRNRVQAYFGPTYRNVPLSYVVQDQQLGSGHALLEAESDIAGTTLVVNGDQIVDSHIIREVLESHTPETAVTLGLLNRAETAEYGGVLLDGDEITEIVEKPCDEKGYRLNAGVYALESAAVAALHEIDPVAGEISLPRGITRLIADEKTVRGVVSSGLWVDATYPWDLLDVSFELFEHNRIDDTNGASISDAATVHDSATIRGPAIIASDCEIGPGAVVGPYACLGENVTVGSNAVVARSVIDTDTRIGSGATVIDAVTGVSVTIGPGTTIPGGPGDVRVGNHVFEAEQLGALLADRVTDKGGTTYVPGTIVGPSSTVEAGATVRGTLSKETEVRT